LILTLMVYFYQPTSNQKNLKVSAPSPNLILPTASFFSTIDYAHILNRNTKQEEEIMAIKTIPLINDPFIRTPYTPEKQTNTLTSEQKTRKSEAIKKQAKSQENDKVKFVLEGIWDSNEKKIAFINGSTLKTNDSLNGYKVISITEKLVVMEKEGRTITLYLEK